MKKVRLGIIGTGIAAWKLHLPALERLGDKFQVTAVCNHTERKAAEFARRLGNVPYVLDYRELLRRDDVEAVDIILPIHLNYRVTRDALEAGKHVIVEKPLAANLRDARKMIGFPGRYHRVMMVAENCRYQSVYLKMAELLRRGIIGKPFAAVWNSFQRMSTDNVYAQTRWRIRHRYRGGFLTDGGVHNAAVLRMLFGDVTAVSSLTGSVNPKIGKMDALSLLFATRRGVQGTFNLFFTTIGYSERRLTVFGRKGTLIAEDNIIRVKRSGNRDVTLDCVDDGGFRAELLDFYRGIRQGKEVRSSFREGYQDLALILDALTAGRRGPARVTRSS